MMRATVFSIVLAGWMWPATATGVARADLKVGDQAPPFTLPGSDGRMYHLSDFRGKQVVVLAWFAKAFTSG